MKKIILVTLISMLAVANAAAQVRFGVKAGATINSLSFKKDVPLLSQDNGGGFHIGAMIEFKVPIAGLGVDISALYLRMNGPREDGSRAKRDMFDIPINLKFKVHLGPVGKAVAPMLFTGPNFSVLMSKDAVYNMFHRKDVTFGWNFGFGAEIVSHVQLTATYHIGFTNAYSYGNQGGLGVKDRYWMVSAAYLF